MSMGKQAKVLSDVQFRRLLHFIETETLFPARNRVIILFSFKAGLRAKEIALVTWSMVTDASGGVAESLALPDVASKGRSGRVIPLHPELRKALGVLQDHERTKGRLAGEAFIVTLKTALVDPASRSNSVQCLFKDWYARAGFEGASSHSGRRTFITNAARKIGEVGGSIRDVQRLAGHAGLQMTQRYVDADPEAQRKLIERI